MHLAHPMPNHATSPDENGHPAPKKLRGRMPPSMANTASTPFPPLTSRSSCACCRSDVGGCERPIPTPCPRQRLARWDGEIYVHASKAIMALPRAAPLHQPRTTALQMVRRCQRNETVHRTRHLAAAAFMCSTIR